MGCLQTGKKSYFEINNSEEKQIRKWEKEIGSFSFDFNTLQQRLTNTSKSYSKTLIKKVSNTQISSFFYSIFENSSFFLEEDGNFNVQKTIALLFLLSSPAVVSNKHISYFDKSYFIYLKSRTNPEDELDEAFIKSSSLTEFIRILVQVSCFGFLKSYYKAQSIPERGLLDELKEEQVDKVSLFIIEELFSLGGNKVDVLSFKELSNKFSNDVFFMSSGYIREMVYCYLLKRKEKDGKDGKDEKK